MARSCGSKFIVKKKLTKRCNDVTDWDNKYANPKHIRRIMSASNQELEYLKTNNNADR